MFRSEKHVIGLDVGTATVKLTHLVEGKNGPELLGAAVVRLPEGAVGESGVADPELVGGAIKEALLEAGVGRNAHQVVAGIPGKFLTVRALTVPTMDHSELREAVKWEAAQYLAYPVEDAAFDFIELGPGSATGTLEVLAIATRRSVVEGLVKAIELAGLEPIALDAVPLALGRILVPEEGEPQVSISDRQVAAAKEGLLDDVVAVADIGAASTDVSIFLRGRLRVSRSIPTGGDRFTSELSTRLGLGVDEAEALKTRELDVMGEAEASSREGLAVMVARDVAEELAEEIQRSLDYFRAQSHWLPVSVLLLTGRGSRLKGLDRALAEHLNLRVEAVDPAGYLPSRVNRNVKPEFLSPTSLGLALWEVNRA